MTMNGNINIYPGSDPILLGSGLDLDTKFREIEKMEQMLSQQKQQLLKLQGHASIEQQPAQARSQTPIWDEIDAITAGMTQKEYDKLMASEEFQESAQALGNLIQAVQLSQIRPIVEASEQGQTILSQHLTIVKRLKKSVSAEVDKELDDFQIYKEKFSDIPYADYLKMKKTKKGGK